MEVRKALGQGTCWGSLCADGTCCTQEVKSATAECIFNKIDEKMVMHGIPVFVLGWTTRSMRRWSCTAFLCLF